MDTHPAIKEVQPEELRIGILPSLARKAFIACTQTFTFLAHSAWYLAGGTGLALQVGHRASVDLDFFIPHGSFDETGMERNLFNTGKWKTSSREKGTLYGEFMGAKMSYIAYPFFQPSKKFLQCGVITLLLPHDIAAMKIVAVSQRGRKRDFVDLYWYCLNRESLLVVVQYAINHYPGQEHNMPHILKSLVYFVDAEEDPMPELFFDADWKTIKAYFQKEVPRIAKELLHLE